MLYITYGTNDVVMEETIDFDEATKERIRSIVTCDRFVVAF